MRKHPYVYFVRDRIDGTVKIGHSANIKSRLESLRSYYKADLEVIGLLKGVHADEQKIHKRFAGSRLSGEWFMLSDDIASFIARKCIPYSKHLDRIAKEDATAILRGNRNPRKRTLEALGLERVVTYRSKAPSKKHKNGER